jgi:hypothetical protein
LQNDVAKNSSGRSTAVITPRSGYSGTTRNKGKAHIPSPSYKRPQGSIGQSNHDSRGSFGGNSIKGIFGNMGSGGHPRDAKADFKSLSKSHISDKIVKHNGGAFGSKSCDSWNKAKDQLTTDEYNKRCRKMLVLIMVRLVTNFLIV